MGKIGKGKATVCAVIDQKLLDAIEQRRTALTLSRSAYTGLILQKWEKDGFPAVSSADYAVHEMNKRLQRRG